MGEFFSNQGVASDQGVGASSFAGPEAGLTTAGSKQGNRPLFSGIDAFTGKERGRNIGQQVLDPAGLFLKGSGSPLDLSQFSQGIFAQEPEFTEGFDPDLDRSLPGVLDAVGGLRADPRALNQLRGEALRQGPSRFTRLRAGQLPGEAAAAGGRLQAQAAAQGASARGGLAARGGLTGGARERLAQESQRSAFAGLRGAEAGRAGQLGKLALADERSRESGLSSQFGREIQALAPGFQRLQAGTQAKQFDVQAKQSEALRRTAFDLGKFQSKQQTAGALAQAQATGEAGKK